MDVVIRCKFLLGSIFSLLSLAVSGQVGVAYDLQKPAKYENRILASEKSTERKFPKSRRFFQNTITHYNYYFNANNKLNDVIARAKDQHKDDYTKLLSFYNYTLEATALQKRELDSVIYKCTAGILIHDTRNDWIDNLYLLIGRSYFFRKTFDTAYITFQFLNYAFAPKEKDGYDKPIASNANEDDGGNANIVSTKEKRNIAQKLLSLPPSRNESLVWQVRTYLATDRFPEAAALIAVLKKDPQFPPRLIPGLEEVQALWFYKQDQYDSAAFHLERALPAAQGNEEVARWEYLIAQLYERAAHPFEAKTFYERTIRHTFNPVLEVYARLNAIRQTKDNSPDFIQKNIDALVSMAKKDRYEIYRDIIYYTAAQIELERNNKPGAEAFLLQSIRSSVNLSEQRNKAFLQLANLSFEEKKYKAAKSYYDSLNLSDVYSTGELSWLPDRKKALANIVKQMLIIERQDSLQRIAALPPAERDAYVKKLARALRRQQGLHDETEDGKTDNTPFFNNNNAKAPPDLFSSGAGEWYFNNLALKAKGYSDFKTKWGNRQNVDNWQLASLASQAPIGKPGDPKMPATLEELSPNKNTGTDAISFKSLLDKLPLTPEKMKLSNDSVEKALYALGVGYQEGIPDYQSAIKTYETLLAKSADSLKPTQMREQTLLNLFYCYKKVGDQANMDRIRQLMKRQYPGGEFTAMAINPDSVHQVSDKLKADATRQYERIYNSFIEGRFEEALAEKKEADSLYGSLYWTPQLLYIESVYLIRTRQDSQAKTILNDIQNKFPKTPMAAKAANLLSVLNRRREIEDYLTKLKVERAKDDDSTIIQPITARTTPADSAQQKEDSSQLAKTRIGVRTQPAVQNEKPGAPGAALPKMKVDTSRMASIKMNADELAMLKKRADSMQAAIKKAYADSVTLARSRKQSDSIKLAALQRRNDSTRAALRKLQADTAQLGAQIRALNSPFAYNPEQPHAVLIIMNKVDPVYVTESRNAFSRYNQENYFSRNLTTTSPDWTDTVKLVVINPFLNAAAASDYMKKAAALAPRELVPWLPVNKYSFVIISAANLELLLENKDIAAYRKFFLAIYPGAK